jgi:hypothetical protein
VTPAVHDLHASAAASPSATKPTGELLPALVVRAAPVSETRHEMIEPFRQREMAPPLE